MDCVYFLWFFFVVVFFCFYSALFVCMFVCFLKRESAWTWVGRKVSRIWEDLEGGESMIRIHHMNSVN